MTDMGQPRGAAGPQWTVDQLADLHAGVLTEAEASALWPQVQADPDAQAVLAALDATVADLGALADVPVEPMPAHVAARIDAALASEAAARPSQPSGQIAPVVDLAAARRRRNRQLGWGLGLVSAAAAAVAVVAVISPGSTSTSGTPLAGPDKGNTATQPGARPPLAVSPEEPEKSFGEISGVHDYGALGGRGGLDACLEAHNLPTDGDTAGVRPATIEGKPAVLAVLTTGELATFRIIAVSPDCSADNPGALYIDKTFGRGEGN